LPEPQVTDSAEEMPCPLVDFPSGRSPGGFSGFWSAWSELAASAFNRRADAALATPSLAFGRLEMLDVPLEPDPQAVAKIIGVRVRKDKDFLFIVFSWFRLPLPLLVLLI